MADADRFLGVDHGASRSATDVAGPPRSPVNYAGLDHDQIASVRLIFREEMVALHAEAIKSMLRDVQRQQTTQADFSS